jgi:pantoate--beta-alanine ligase
MIRKERNMRTVTTITELRQNRQELPGPLALVPTMGYLHAGHLSLIQQARRECRSVIASIFVNPTQFGPQEDFARYPRDLPHDLERLQSAGVDMVWAPETSEMYPNGYQTWITVDEIPQVLEGAMRPGHFRGVATVVAKLLNAVQPERAYFGQKDAQQVAVIRRMVLDLNFPLEVVVCPIVREADGLAMSSRNVYLTPEQRRAASVIYRALMQAQAAFDTGERHPGRLRQIVLNELATEPQARLEYVSCADPDTFHELEAPFDRALILLAVYFGTTRLIDNWVLEAPNLLK